MNYIMLGQDFPAFEYRFPPIDLFNGYVYSL